MNRELVDRIVHAVLYEGYVLYPYRPALKNRQRWTFGGLYPESYCAAQQTGDASTIQTECLLLGPPETTLDVVVRFLHLIDRTVGELDPPLPAMPPFGVPPYRTVPSLKVGTVEYQPWQEAAEREVSLGPLVLRDLLAAPRTRLVTFPAQFNLEPLRDPAGNIRGLLARRQHAVYGAVELSATRESHDPSRNPSHTASDGQSDHLTRLTVRITNQTPLADASHATRDEALMRSLVSTHTILSIREQHAPGAQFLSLIDPPAPFAAAAARCRNVGAWPVLVGDDHEHDTVLSSPIILYDHPQLAPESPGEFFDATEIDEMLTLRILTLSDDEKRAMAAIDPHTRALLDRTELHARAHLSSLHGALRGLRQVTPPATPPVTSPVIHSVMHEPPPDLSSPQPGGAP